MIFNKILKNQEAVLNLICDSLNRKSNICLTYFNQHCFNIYYTVKSYRNLIDSEIILYLDGIGIYLALKMFGHKNVKRFNATDMNDIIISELVRRKVKVFIIGGRFTEDLLIRIIEEKQLNICGYHEGYFNKIEVSSLEKAINNSGAEVVLIGMGVPTQEFLASEISKNVDINLIICVGNFLEYYFGTKKRILKPLRNIGIEWLYRLIIEPRRLWKRYVIGIPPFIIRIIKLRLNKTKSV